MYSEESAIIRESDKSDKQDEKHGQRYVTDKVDRKYGRRKW